jgi:hypothetical protein
MMAQHRVLRGSSVSSGKSFASSVAVWRPGGDVYFQIASRSGDKWLASLVHVSQIVTSLQSLRGDFEIMQREVEHRDPLDHVLKTLRGPRLEVSKCKMGKEGSKSPNTGNHGLSSEAVESKTPLGWQIQRLVRSSQPSW